MIITNKGLIDGFTPIEISVIIENKEEAARWYSIFDLVAIKEVLGYGNAVDIRTGLSEYFTWDMNQQVEDDFINAVYNIYKDQLIELINNDKLG